MNTTLDTNKTALPGPDEPLIRAKMTAGLTRQQAIDVIQRQLEFDKNQPGAFRKRK